MNYLKRIYAQTDGGKLNPKQRLQAIKTTGLSWIQIYKWIFDVQKKEAKDANNSDRIFKVTGRDGLEIAWPSPIFKVEKVTR